VFAKPRLGHFLAALQLGPQGIAWSLSFPLVVRGMRKVRTHGVSHLWQCSVYEASVRGQQLKLSLVEFAQRSLVQLLPFHDVPNEVAACGNRHPLSPAPEMDSTEKPRADGTGRGA